MDDQYANWKRRLAGEKLPIHDGDPDSGFYRMRLREGGFQPVAYWQKDGALRTRFGDKDIEEQLGRERWVWCAEHPISHDLYKKIIAGERWPDESEAAGFGHNKGPDLDTFDGIKDRAEDLVRSAEKLIAGGAAKSQDAADQAAHLAEAIADLKKKAEAGHKAEKAPFLEGGRKVDAKWKPIIELTGIYDRIKIAVTTPWLKKLDAEKRAAEEALRKASEKAAETGDDVPQELVAKAAAPIQAGSGGRRTESLREVKTIEIVDYEKVVAFMKGRDDVKEFFQTLCNRALRAGVEVPGTKINIDQKAV